MAFTAQNQKPQPRTFHATVVVTRLEDWCVEARTPQEARELIAAGAGYRCDIGDCLNIEIDQFESEI
jgi:hypothetical protein